MVFADLCVAPQAFEEDVLKPLVKRALILGYGLLGFSLPLDRPSQSFEKAKRVCSSLGLDASSRIDLAPESEAELRRLLSKVRKRFEIVAVCCKNARVARAACRDRRVDIVYFPKAEKPLFRGVEATFAAEGETAYEVRVGELVRLEREELLGELWRISIELGFACREGVPVLLTSFASDELGLRAPRDLIAFCTTVLGVDSRTAKYGISQYAKDLVSKNRLKLSSKFVADGVWVVRSSCGH